MRTVRGARVVITGAASGMGLRYAERAVAEGAHSLALWDRDFEGLQRAREILGSRSAVSSHTVDLADPQSISAAYAETRSKLGIADVLINNAGIVSGNQYFWDTDMQRDNELTMRVNVLAHMQVTRLFLPDMMAETGRAKRILNVASAAATVSNPRMSVYAASKWALYGWSDSLRLELRQAGIRHISVTTFCPSYVSTGMFAGARGMFLTPVIRPEAAVQAAWSAMLAGKPVLLTPWAVNLAKFLRGVLPVRSWDVLAGWMRVYSSMDKFTGRMPER